YKHHSGNGRCENCQPSEGAWNTRRRRFHTCGQDCDDRDWRQKKSERCQSDSPKWNELRRGCYDSLTSPSTHPGRPARPHDQHALGHLPQFSRKEYRRRMHSTLEESQGRSLPKIISWTLQEDEQES